MASDPFYRRRERATEAGYDIDKRGRKSFHLGYDDGYGLRPREQLVARPVAYKQGYAQGIDDRAEVRMAEASRIKGGFAARALADGLKNARRTATRRLDEAGVPDDKQGNTEGEW